MGFCIEDLSFVLGEYSTSTESWSLGKSFLATAEATSDESVGCRQKMIYVVSYDRAMCYPLYHKSMQCARSGGCPWHWWHPYCDRGQQWKKSAFHPSTKGTKQLWLCPQAKNGCGYRRYISVFTAFLILIFEWQVNKGLISLPVN